MQNGRHHREFFQLYYKKSPSVLKGKMLENGKYEYERSVTYWMPFNGDWDFMMLHGSHTLEEIVSEKVVDPDGCINLPADKAAELYNKDKRKCTDCLFY